MLCLGLLEKIILAVVDEGRFVSLMNCGTIVGWGFFFLLVCRPSKRFSHYSRYCFVSVNSGGDQLLAGFFLAGMSFKQALLLLLTLFI